MADVLKKIDDNIRTRIKGILWIGQYLLNTNENFTEKYILTSSLPSIFWLFQPVQLNLQRGQIIQEQIINNVIQVEKAKKFTMCCVHVLAKTLNFHVTVP